MQYKSTKGYTGWSQLAILLVFLGLGMFLASIFELYIGSKALGATTLSFSERGPAIIKALIKPENVNYAQAGQIIGTFFILFFPAFAYVLICHKKLFWAGFSAHLNIYQLILGFLIMSCTSFFADPFATISKSVFAHFPVWRRACR